MPVAGPSGASSEETRLMTVKRKADGEEPDLHSLLPESTRALVTSKITAPVVKKRKTDLKNSLGIKIKKAPAKAVVAAS